MTHSAFASRPLSPCPHQHMFERIKSAPDTHWTASGIPVRVGNPQAELGAHGLVFKGVSQEIVDGSVVALVGLYVCGPWCAGGGFLVGYIASAYLRAA